MNEDLAPPAPAASPGATVPMVLAEATAPAAPPRAWWMAVAVLAALCVASLLLAWRAEQRGSSLEQELVRRQQEAALKLGEARGAARQAQENGAETAAKLALLEARVAEVAVQRGQLEELMQSLSRSRDENLLVDVEAAIRVAVQQAAITGSAEPIVATLRQSDERLARHSQPRLESVRRAITRDLDRVKATSVADIGSLGIRLDEAVRLVDELPLLASAGVRGGGKEAVKPGATGPVAPATAASGIAGWAERAGNGWSSFVAGVWAEARSLVRVSRIEHPEAMLVAPEQSFFLRENLKLRLLNARLALLSRQFDTAQADLVAAQAALERYFDRSAKPTGLVIELIRQVAGQARQVVVPRPDDTLAALAAASAGR